MTNEGKPFEIVSPTLETIKGRTYLVTEDLSKIITTWCKAQGKPFPDPEGPFYTEIVNSLCDALQRLGFPTGDVKVVALPHASFADILDRRRSYDAKMLNEFWVSLDHVYSDVGEKGQDGFEISITRFVDQDSEALRRGPRPETDFTTIREQVAACARCWREASQDGPRPIVLIDDGSITGGTILTVL